MKRRPGLAFLVPFLLATPALAEEGMWTPDQLPEIREQLKAAGLRLDVRQLADLDRYPLDAVVSLGNCTASFVSADGLVITNHHCARGAIQYNSTAERNLLRDGFLARSREEELPAGPGSRILVTDEIRDVTAELLAGLGDDVHGNARYDAIEKRQKELVAACEKTPGSRCRVASFNGGLQYKLVRQLEIRDVRLVYAPCEGIGEFGGEVDNFMWPRHEGDYAFYRAYVGKDGGPADYSKDNVPYHPKHFLKVSVDGVREGDFVLVAGYPGSTSRYRTAREVEYAASRRYPAMKERYDTWISILDAETRDRPEAAIKVASQLAGLRNTDKNYAGMLAGFRKTDVVDRKRTDEATLQQWIDHDPQRRQRYGAAVSTLDALVERDIARQEREMQPEFLDRTSSLLRSATRLYRLSKEKQKPDAERHSGYQERDVQRMRETLARLEKTFDAPSERAVWRKFILDAAALPPEQHVQAFDRWFGIEGNRLDPARLDARLDEMFAKTRLGDTPTRLGWMTAKPEEFEKSDDPFIQLAVQLYPESMTREHEDEELVGLLQEHRPRYMQALLARQASLGKPVYPDANGTLRVTYGSIRGSAAQDGLAYTPFTTVDGVLAKDTGTAPFQSPPALLAAIRTKRWGASRDPRLGVVPVDFLSTLDTTGGNSGSPTLNARGELVGLLFDGTFDSINSDWYFDDATNRSIHVDIRYVVWIMDEVDGAQHLLKEMGVQSGVAAGE